MKTTRIENAKTATVFCRCMAVAALLALLLPAACRREPDGNAFDPFDDSDPILVQGPARSISEFELILEKMRRNLRIPAFSAAIARGGKTVWAKGFGWADVEARRAAQPGTIYHLASLTKPYAATIILQLEGEGLLSLQDPVSRYGIQLESDGVVRVIHLLTHTSEGVPGAIFHYNGNRFAQLETVVTAASGRSFCQLLRDRIIVPLQLAWTVPNPLASNNCMLTGASERERIASVLAQGYSTDGNRRESYPEYFGTAAGLVSTAPEVAAFSTALDQERLLPPEAMARMFTPFVSNSGEDLPYGLGWFIYRESGLKIVWHYGYWTANSSLIVKVPERELTFVICANSDKLSSASPGIGNDANLRRSVVAGEFLDAFVFGTAPLPE